MKDEIIKTLELCVSLLDTSGVNSKQIVKNTLTDLIEDIKGCKSVENGLPF